MNTKIIGISGRKQSGKNTLANYINGDILKKRGMVQDFSISQKGELKILTCTEDGESNWGIFDVTRKDESFVSYAERELWPFVKLYHFADYLKKMSIDLFDLRPEQVYGTDEDKNTPTDYDMTSREFLQYLGTDVMRSIKNTIWVDYTIKIIQQEKPLVSIIPDVRFPNEVEAIKEAGGIVVRLDRNVYDSPHQCESSLDQENFDWNDFDVILKNNDIKIEEFIAGLEEIQPLWRNL
jgi:hypothetical protein